jgi:aryl-alcohol dehydrogenase-like predicted oxidoreductase
VPWSPLGSGFLTGTIKQLESNDFRNNNPKFAGGNLQTNLDRFAPLTTLAQELGITTAQLALAWLLHQDENIIPIPGTRTPARVIENAAAAEVVLNATTLNEVNRIASLGAAQGATLV